MAYVPVPKDLDRRKNEGPVQHNKTVACLFQRRCACWRPAFKIPPRLFYITECLKSKIATCS